MAMFIGTLQESKQKFEDQVRNFRGIPLKSVMSAFKPVLLAHAL